MVKKLLPIALALIATAGVGLVEVAWHHDHGPVGIILCNGLWCAEPEQGIHLATVLILAATWGMAAMALRRGKRRMR